MLRSEPMAREEGRNAQRKALVGEEPGGQIYGHSELAAALVDRGGGGNRFLEHEISQLTDAVVLLGGGNELRRSNRAFFRVRPAGERLGADDPPRPKVELGLIGDPHFA